MKKALLLAFCLNFVQIASAQLEKVLHQTFELSDSITSVSLNIYGDYEFQKWSSNTIMVETSIELYDASPSILNHFVKKGRYDLVFAAKGAMLNLDSKDLERTAIKTRVKNKKNKNSDEIETKQCFEIVKVRVFIPDSFLVVDRTMLNKIVAEEEATATSNE